MSLSPHHDTNASTLCGGFFDPVRQAQQAFHALMNALARPGTVQPIEAVEAPAALPGLFGTIACTLLDPDTRLFLDSSLSGDPHVAEWLTFQTGTAIVGHESEAMFGMISDSREVELAAFCAGDQAYPNRSATLCLSVSSFSGGKALRCTGPGIETSHTIAPAGLPADFVEQWAANNALFPRGVDLFLVCESEGVIGLPRSTQIASET